LYRYTVNTKTSESDLENSKLGLSFIYMRSLFTRQKMFETELSGVSSV
jgi:hypothetical protein